MTSVRTVNLLWERRYRGAYPASRYALSDEGAVILAIPRPLAARTFDVTTIRPDGAAEIHGGFSVETLLKLEIATPNSAIGMTADDLYLFHAGAKLRFLSERQILFVDSALSANGQQVGAAFSDLAATSFAIAYGDIGGSMRWMRELPGVVTAVAIARDGGRIAAGSEGGAVWLLDSARRELFEFQQDEPVRAIACSEDGALIAFGTASGAVLLVDAEGARRWRVQLDREVTGLALSAAGGLCCVLCAEPACTQVTLLDSGGQIAWEHLLERRSASATLSPDGRYLALGSRDGTCTLFEIVPGAHAGPGPQNDLARWVADSLRMGDLAGAVKFLRDALAATPGDLDLYRELTQRMAEWRSAVHQEASELAAAGSYEASVARLQALLREEPLDVATIQLLLEIRRQWARAGLERAGEPALRSDYAARETLLREAIAADPDLTPAREALGSLVSERAAEFDSEAERYLAEGNLEAALAAVERAQAIAPSSARAANAAQLLLQHEMAVAMDHYNAKRYREAAFQFQKVLALDSANAEARRYYAFSQRFLQDAANDSLSDRFSRLE